MALVVKDRVKETTTTVGTIALVLLGATSGFQSFSVIGNGNTTYYAIDGGAEWEVGIGTYTLVGTTLSRDTILASSNGGSAVNFSAGTKNVFVTYPAGKGLYLDASGNAIALGTPASATLTNATGLPISTGVSGLGTGVATALAVNTGTSGAFVVNGGALGTPSSGTVTNLTGTASININGTVGATTANTGAFTSVTSNTTNATNSITITDTGTSGANIKLAGNGATTPNKTIRAFNGNLGIVNSAYTTEIVTLSDAGGLQVVSFGVGTPASGTSGEIRATNNVTSFYTSDIKFKENINDIPNALDKVNYIGGKLFDWTNDYINNHGGEDGYFVTKSDFGVIAQDVQKVFPIAVREKSDKTLAVDYEKLCALAFAAIKELTEKVNKLEAK